MTISEAIIWCLAALSLASTLCVLFTRDFLISASASFLNVFCIVLLLHLYDHSLIATLTLWAIGGGMLSFTYLIFRFINKDQKEFISRQYLLYKTIPVALIAYLFVRIAFLLFQSGPSNAEVPQRTVIYNDLAMGLVAIDLFIFLSLAFSMFRILAKKETK